MDIKPIETTYDGHLFRSRLEARWAVFFKEAGIKYLYEPEGFVLQNGEHYLPDFYLPESNIWVEVKGHAPTRKELIKCALLNGATNSQVVIVGTIPKDGCNIDMDPDAWPGGYGFSVDYCGINGYQIDWAPYKFSICKKCRAVGFHFEGKRRQCSCAKDDYTYNDTELLSKAYGKARQARFEHAEETKRIRKS